MESLTSPKITVGVHCLKLRTKSMYINAAGWTRRSRRSTIVMTRPRGGA